MKVTVAAEEMQWLKKGCRLRAHLDSKHIAMLKEVFCNFANDGNMEAAEEERDATRSCKQNTAQRTSGAEQVAQVQRVSNRVQRKECEGYTVMRETSCYTR